MKARAFADWLDDTEEGQALHEVLAETNTALQEMLVSPTILSNQKMQEGISDMIWEQLVKVAGEAMNAWWEFEAHQALNGGLTLYYVLFVEGDVEPRLVGPCSSEGKRDDMAKALRRGSGPGHGIFALDLKPQPGSGNLIEVRAYSGQFFEEE